MNKAIFDSFPANLKNILFVCTANICRSATAEVTLKSMLTERGLDISVHSAGTHAPGGQKTVDILIRSLKNKGLDLDSHRSRLLTAVLAEKADIILVMEQAHRTFIIKTMPEVRNKIYLLSDFHPASVMIPPETNIPDPIGMSDFFYENVNDMIYLCCQNISNHLTEVHV